MTTPQATESNTTSPANNAVSPEVLCPKCQSTVTGRRNHRTIQFHAPMEISDGGIALLTWGSLAIASVLWWGGTFAFPKIMVPVNILAYGIMIGGLWKVSGSNPQNETEGD